jgi:hypothetical protein
MEISNALKFTSADGQIQIEETVLLLFPSPPCDPSIVFSNSSCELQAPFENKLPVILHDDPFPDPSIYQDGWRGLVHSELVDKDILSIAKDMKSASYCKEYHLQGFGMVLVSRRYSIVNCECDGCRERKLTIVITIANTLLSQQNNLIVLVLIVFSWTMSCLCLWTHGSKEITRDEGSRNL